MRDFGGKFPDIFASMIKLPGIGEYTAGAIASICFDEKVPAVDGNVLGIAARVTGSRENVLLPEVKKKTGTQLLQILPDNAGTFNEAMMELGETVCLPGDAAMCEECPLRSECVAYRDGLKTELPVRVKRMTRRQERRTVLLLTSADGRVAVEKRPDKGLLAGMYQFPNTEGFLTKEEIRKKTEAKGMRVLEVTYFKDAKHAFTHLDWLMKGYRVSIDKPSGDFLWATPEELQGQYAIPTALKPFVPTEHDPI